MVKTVIDGALFWLSAVYYGVLVLFDILKLIYRNGFGNVFSWQQLTKPSCLDDSGLGTHGYIHLEDVRIHYVASGPEDKPLMLFLHGFPEFWFSWRYQIKEFQKDYRVVAVDMRGYGDSDKPRGIDAYTMKKLTSDVKQMIPALGYKSCILVGHDWGAAIVWSFALQYPEMVDKLIAMNCAHVQVLREIYAKEELQRKMSWYMLYFQLPYLPELSFKLNNFGTMDYIFDRKGARIAYSDAFQTPMNKEEVEAYKYMFSLPDAITGPINYYRALWRRHLDSEKLDLTYPMPVLFIWGLKDQALSPGNPDLTEQLNPSITVKRIPEAGHFVQMDTPNLVNKIMREWLDKQGKP